MYNVHIIVIYNFFCKNKRNENATKRRFRLECKLNFCLETLDNLYTDRPSDV